MTVIEFKAYDGDAKVSYFESDELKEAIFHKILNYYIDHDCYAGEVLMQADDPQINAPVLLADICDELFEFEVEWEDG